MPGVSRVRVLLIMRTFHFHRFRTASECDHRPYFSTCPYSIRSIPLLKSYSLLYFLCSTSLYVSDYTDKAGSAVALDGYGIRYSVLSSR